MSFKRNQTNLFSVDYMEKEAIDFLRENEPEEGYFVGFSGGKDSICTEKLCVLSGVNHKTYHSFTGLDAPEVVQFIKKEYPHVEFLFPKERFWSAIKHKSPPLRMSRWCCDLLKESSGIKQVPELKKCVFGMRAEESPKRAKHGRVSKFRGQTVYRPIFKWTEYHVWEFIKKHNLPYPSLYDEGFDRIGCVICPFIMGKSKACMAKRKESMERWPLMWKAFKNSISSWIESKGEDWTGDDFETYYKKYLNGFED